MLLETAKAIEWGEIEAAMSSLSIVIFRYIHCVFSAYYDSFMDIKKFYV